MSEPPRPKWWNDVTDAISYKRFSKADQAAGFSAARQGQATERYAQEHGLKIVDKYLDAGLSSFGGENADIGALSALLAVITNSNKKFRKSTHLIVESLDRLSRNAMTQALTLFLNLITSGVVIHSLADGQVYSEKEINESPFIISLAIAVLMRGRDESLTKKYRTADNLERNLKLARTEKTPIARPPSWIDTVGERNNKSFVLNRHAATVKRIFEEAAAGLTVHEICRGLNADNVKTFGRSTHWQKGTVSRILM